MPCIYIYSREEHFHLQTPSNSTSMASTCSAIVGSASSSTLAVTKKYDVFISFRGEDTRPDFTSHLHAALCRNSIETYIDYPIQK
ncbi:hypothetical protein glysoja_021724 [Glycine soja]|nr:hypothetical protein glysoja_021724 [Glycine soja]